eukprot:m.453723 g.453723  ORF g.453723 m.453723 type:complete len:878 (+) comp21554_c0_seq2:287-2920(+)
MLKPASASTLSEEEKAAFLIQQWYRKHRTQSQERVQGLLQNTKLRLLEQHQNVTAKTRDSVAASKKQLRRKHPRASKQKPTDEVPTDRDTHQQSSMSNNAGNVSEILGSQRLNHSYLETMKAKAARRMQHQPAGITSTRSSAPESVSDEEAPQPRAQMLRNSKQHPSHRYTTRTDAHPDPTPHATCEQPNQSPTGPSLGSNAHTSIEAAAQHPRKSPSSITHAPVPPTSSESGSMTASGHPTAQPADTRTCADGTAKTSPGMTSSVKDSARLASLLEFLNTVDETNKSIQDELNHHRNSSVFGYGYHGNQKSPAGGVAVVAAGADCEPTDAALETTSAVTAKLIRQELQIKEQGAIIEAYKKKVLRLETELEMHKDASSAKPDKSGKPTTTKAPSGTSGGSVSAAELAESNRTIQRHLQFIDRLIHEKKTLVAQLKELDERCATKISNLRSAHESQLQKQKEFLLTKEKQRREKWMQREAKKIKDMTIKGLEPDIKRLVAEHKAEIERIRSTTGAAEAAQHTHEYSRLREEHAQTIERITSEAASRERAAVAAEREASREMLQKQAVAEEKAFLEEKRKMAAELLSARKDAEEQLATQRSTLKAEFEASQEMTQLSLRRARSDSERLLRDTHARHDEELRNLKAQLAIEKESWEDMFMRKQESRMKAKEQEIRERLRVDRDKQLAMAIERLASEASTKETEYKQEYDQRLKRMQQKMRNQLEDAEQAERATLAKYNDARQRLVEASEELSSVRGILVQREQDLARAQEVSERLSSERDKVADIVRVEFAESLATSEALVESLRRDLREAKETSYREIENVRSAKDAELDDIHHRVQKTVAKKDETILLLRAQAEAASKRVDQLESLVETQRQHMLQM